MPPFYEIIYYSTENAIVLRDSPALLMIIYIHIFII